MDDERADHRRQLIALEQKAQESYDKTVLSLSGGALGVSFAFVTGFVERGSMQASGLLMGAWFSWALSLASTLASHFTSQAAMRRAIKELDSDRAVEQPGGYYDRFTAILNATAGLLFLAGVVFVGVFVWRNV
jgi:CDP-diglyceride synthetase